MHIITRKKNEGIVIRDDVIVNVLEIRDGQVRLGVEHPIEVSVRRGEVADAFHQAKEESPRPR